MSDRPDGSPCLRPADVAAVLRAAVSAGPVRSYPLLPLVAATAGLGLGFAAVAAWLPFALAAIPLIALCLTVLSVAVHEAAHGSLFRRRWLNAAAGFATGVATFTPFGSYRRGHRAHHRWAGSATGHDPTAAPLGPVAPGRPLDLAVRLRVPVLFWGGVYLPYLIYDLHPTAGPRKFTHLLTWAANVAIIAAVHVLLARAVGWSAYLIAAAGGFVGWGVLYEALFTRHQHVGLLPVPAGKERYRTTEQAQFSRSVRVPLAGLFFYFNLHKEHHLFPALPSGYLPRVRDALRAVRPDVAGFTSSERRPPARARDLLTPRPGDP
jgi:fatty acid desaturase